MAARRADPPLRRTGRMARRRFATWTARIAAATLGGYFGYLSLEGSRRLLRPDRRALVPAGDGPATPADLGLPYEDVSFTTTDGVTLAGWLIPAARETRKAVILLHGFAGNRLPDLVEYVPWLREDHHVLQFDFRGHGASGDAPVALAALAREDVPAAVRFMESRGLGPIALMGISLGASVAIMAAGRLPVAAVVADAPFADLKNPVGNRMRLGRYPLAALGSRVIVVAATLRARTRIYPLREVGRISPRALLLIAPREDRLIGYQQSVKLYDAAGEPRELYVVEGADHARAHSVAGAEYEKRVLSFLERSLARELSPQPRDEAAGAFPASFYNAAADRPRLAPLPAEDA